jgi:hypothetical protein
MQRHERQRIPDWQKRRLVDAQDYKCRRCGDRIGWSYQIDHVLPLHHGGGNEIENLQALCGTCHNEKTLIESAGPAASIVACPGCATVYSRYFGHMTCAPGVSTADRFKKKSRPSGRDRQPSVM